MKCFYDIMTNITQDYVAKISIQIIGALLSLLIAFSAWTVAGLRQDVRELKRIQEQTTIEIHGQMQSRMLLMENELSHIDNRFERVEMLLISINGYKEDDE